MTDGTVAPEGGMDIISTWTFVGTGNPDDIYVEEGKRVGDISKPAKSGHTFDHWEVDGQRVDDDMIIPPGGLVLTPIWTKNPENTNTVVVRYWSDGVRINTVDIVKGDVLYNPGAPGLRLVENRNFKYWRTSDGEQYEFRKRLFSDLDLYAVWSE